MNLLRHPVRQKRQQFVSPALRASAKGQPCSLRTLSSAHGLRPLDLVAASAEDGAGTDGALVMADQWAGWAEAQREGTR